MLALGIGASAGHRRQRRRLIAVVRCCWLLDDSASALSDHAFTMYFLPLNFQPVVVRLDLEHDGGRCIFTVSRPKQRVLTSQLPLQTHRIAKYGNEKTIHIPEFGQGRASKTRTLRNPRVPCRFGEVEELRGVVGRMKDSEATPSDVPQTTSLTTVGNCKSPYFPQRPHSDWS